MPPPTHFRPGGGLAIYLHNDPREDWPRQGSTGRRERIPGPADSQESREGPGLVLLWNRPQHVRMGMHSNDTGWRLRWVVRVNGREMSVAAHGTVLS
jgi:hypothetical protein